MKMLAISAIMLLLSGCAINTAKTICLEHGQLLDTYQKRGQFESVKCQ